ncbi:hypothetical protein HZC32_00250 [Candidatus Woesearchaeota archaeon]|nr:hypothetical protein [Candidatus Woesearchaeota archaeon]
MTEELWKEKEPKRSELLIQYGFIKSNKKGNYVFNEAKKIYEPVPGYGLKEEDAEEEVAEIIKEHFGKTGYPTSLKTYHLVWEVYDLSLEEPYFWILDNLKESFPEIYKLEDAFAAAENSAFFGVTQQRLGAQQEKISQFLIAAGKMIKELFQMVRELRILDERLGYYNQVKEELEKPISSRGKGAEITLKGIFVDLVQGGAKSAASVFGMARELEFVTLPDLFFDAPPFKDEHELESYINDLSKDFNRNVLRVLHRHLHQYTEWRKRTHKEHKSRRVFMLRYLLQHFEIIKMYTAWIKPYLKHIPRLSMKEKSMSSADIVSAFEGSMLDVEVLARKSRDGANACILATFHYRTRPELKVVQEGYQRGPVHIGKFEVYLRAYTWTDEQVEGYKQLKDKETMLLMADISGSVYQAMGSLGEELEKYIAEAKGEQKKETEKNREVSAPKKTFMEKFFGDFYTPQKGKKAVSPKEVRGKTEKVKEALGSLRKEATDPAWNTYHNFKKAHGMIAW